MIMSLFHKTTKLGYSKELLKLNNLSVFFHFSENLFHCDETLNFFKYNEISNFKQHHQIFDFFHACEPASQNAPNSNF